MNLKSKKPKKRTRLKYNGEYKCLPKDVYRPNSVTRGLCDQKQLTLGETKSTSDLPPELAYLDDLVKENILNAKESIQSTKSKPQTWEETVFIEHLRIKQAHISKLTVENLKSQANQLSPKEAARQIMYLQEQKQAKLKKKRRRRMRKSESDIEPIRAESKRSPPTLFRSLAKYVKPEQELNNIITSEEISALKSAIIQHLSESVDSV